RLSEPGRTSTELDCTLGSRALSGLHRSRGSFFLRRAKPARGRQSSPAHANSSRGQLSSSLLKSPDEPASEPQRTPVVLCQCAIGKAEPEKDDPQIRP